MNTTSGNAWTEPNPNRRKGSPYDYAYRTFNTVTAEPPPGLPFGMSAGFMVNPRGRPFFIAVLTPLILGTPRLLTFLAFSWTATGGDSTFGGATFSGSNPLVFPARRTPNVYIHSPWWPFERLAELTTAHNIDRSFERMAQGHAALHVSFNDPQLTTDVVQEGNLLVIQTNDQPDWVGTLVTLTESAATGEIELQALGLAAILDGRNAPQGEQYTTAIGSGVIFNSLIARMNARAHTGIFKSSRAEVGPSVTNLQVGGQSVLQALNELHTRTDYEWWVDARAYPGKIEAEVSWGYRQGGDKDLGNATLYQGQHFNNVEYTLDLSQVKQVVTAIGEFGANLPERNSVSHAVSRNPQLTDTGTSTINIASQDAVRSIQALPPGLRNEKVIFEVVTGDTAELARRAKRALERPFAGAERFTLEVNRNADWSNLAVGNYITIVVNLGLTQAARIVRIVGVQPDEERGLCQVIVEVPFN